jgi:hypothetical protein
MRADARQHALAANRCRHDHHEGKCATLLGSVLTFDASAPNQMAIILFSFIF